MRVAQKFVSLLLLGLMLVPQLAISASPVALCPMGESSGPCGCGHTEPVSATIPGGEVSAAGCCKLVPAAPLNFVRLESADRIAMAPSAGSLELVELDDAAAAQLRSPRGETSNERLSGPPLHLRIEHFLI